MSLYFDRVSRTYILQTPAPREGVMIRTHSAPTTAEKLAAQRQRMRAGAREVLETLAKAERSLTFHQIQEALPHVSTDTLQVRLCQLTAREDIERYGRKGHYHYTLPEGSTYRST